MPEFDTQDGEILAVRQAAFDALNGPRVGDWCNMPDGSTRRFTHDLGNALQITFYNDESGYGDQRFYLDTNGMVSYSGTLGPSLPKSALNDTGATQVAWFWFFHHGVLQANNAVSVSFPCRIYAFTGE